MPSYRSGSDDYVVRKPKVTPDKVYYEPDMDDGEEDDMMEEKKNCKKPCFCKVEVPFKVLVKVIPCEEREHECKHPM